MSTVLKIPMSKDFLDELEDAFIDKDESSHDFVWKEIRRLCKDAKLGKLNKSCVVSIIKNGQQIQDTVKLREVTLVDVESDPKWIPNSLEQDDVGYFEHSVTDKTLKYLKLYASYSILRHQKYAQSVTEENAKLIQKMQEANTKQSIIDDARETHKKTDETIARGLPSCIEEAVYAGIFSVIHAHVAANIDAQFDKENEEMYPKEKPIPAK
jgi:hypothetical protein